MIKNNLRYIAAIGAVAASLTLGALAADGGIVDVDTRLNVRSAASTSASVKARLWDGQVITLHDKKGNWWYVEYSPNTYGYVSADYINTLSLKEGEVAVSYGSLNVRSAASPAATVTDKLPKGEDVLILGTYGSFYKILYKGNLVGYVAKEYISLGAAQSGTYAKVSLAVPSYKQYNYSSLRLPGSGERVSTHGCAVSSLAMTESFRRGVSVTPKDVIQNEKFTSSGNIYWPLVYSANGTSLSFVYSKLKSGVPVIIHVKTNGGATHFAVITGFSGGELSAKNFKILDPGSATRTTLADLLTAYPVTVKTLSY